MRTIRDRQITRAPALPVLLCAFALACAFAVLATGCNQINEEEALVRAERAERTWNAWLTDPATPGAADLAELFGVYTVEDEWGIALPHIDLDGDKTKLIVDLMEAYNLTVSEKEQLTVTQAFEAFERLAETLGLPDRDDPALAFVTWCVSPAPDGSGRSNAAVVAAGA